MSIMFRRGAHGVGDPEISDSERRHADQIKFGTVRQVDYGKARVRVAIGDETDDEGHLLTGWLPMPGGRARGDSDWHPLEIGERVVVLSESGEVQNGVVLPAGIYSDDDPAPGDKAGLWRKKFQDGGTVEYDRDSGEFKVAAMGKATLSVGSASIVVTSSGVTLSAGGVTLALTGGGVAITGGTITHDNHAIDKTHLHVNTMSGPGTSGPPQ